MALAWTADAGAAPLAPSVEIAPGEVVVRWRAPRVVTAALASAPKLTRVGSLVVDAQRTLFDRTQLLTLHQRTRTATLAAVAELRRRSDVLYAEPNVVRRPFARPNDARWPLQWNLQRVRMPAAWDLTTGDSGVVVAVVDTGVKRGHPELAGRLLPGYDFISSTTRSGDGDGWDADPDDAGNNTGASSAFHGTHVAGVIGANGNNQVGVAGVDWRCRIVPVRALGVIRGGGTDSDIAAAIRWAAGLFVKGVPFNPNPAHIINLSFGGSGKTVVLSDAIRAVVAHGVVVVAAAGNETQDVANIYPAAAPGVITVGASDLDNRRAAYSNYGAAIDIIAPGGQMKQRLSLTYDGRSDWPAGALSTMYFAPGARPYTWGYQMVDGTSQAAPLVAGVVALMIARNPRISATEALDVLKGTADSSATCAEGCGAGLLRADAAVRHAVNPAGNGSRPSASTGPVGPRPPPRGEVTTVHGSSGCAVAPRSSRAESRTGRDAAGTAMLLALAALALAVARRRRALRD